MQETEAESRPSDLEAFWRRAPLDREMMLARLRRRGATEGDQRVRVRDTWRQLLRRCGFEVAPTGRWGPNLTSATEAALSWADRRWLGSVGPSELRAIEAKYTSLPTVPALGTGWKRYPIVDARWGRNGYPVHRWRRWPRRSARDVEAVVGHHSGGPGTAASDGRFHVESGYLSPGGAPGLAYHLHVDLAGTLIVSANWDEVTWSVNAGKNTGTLSICMQGNTNQGSITAAQQATVWDVIRRLRQGNFNPFRNEPAWPRVEPLTTHRHIHPTDCPGDPGEHFYRRMAEGRWLAVL